MWWRLVYILSTSLLVLSCGHRLKSGVSQLEFKNLPSLGKSPAGQEIFLGGFSGLVYLGPGKDGDRHFVTHTDRGPNGDQYNGNRPFAIPDFNLQWVFFKLDKDLKLVTLERQIPLRTKDGAISGLPNQVGPEDPVDVFDYLLPFDPNGMDAEALARDDKGNYWMAEEYGPSLAEFSPDGVLIKRYLPGQGLPAIFKDRRSNRGFEGIAIQNQKLYAFIQSPLAKDKNPPRSPILVFDLKTKKPLAEKYYPFDSMKADKIGDVTPYKDGFLVLEQNDSTGKKAFKRIYHAKEVPGQTDLKKELFLDLADLGLGIFEKLEGIALIEDRYLAIVNDNDFGIKGRPDYLKSGLVPTKEEGSYLFLIDLSKVR